MASTKRRILVRCDHVRQRIAEANLTEAEAAELIGVDRVTLSRWLRGRASPTPRARRLVLASDLFADAVFGDLFVMEAA